MVLHLQAASLTDTGKVRKQNEDYCFFQTSSTGTGSKGLFIVADGMGGYQAGEVASQLTVDKIREVLNPFFASSGQETTILAPTNSPDSGNKTRRLPESRQLARISADIKQAVMQANEVILNYGKAHREARGLGSTVTFAVVLGTHAFIANVGDSRTYLLRQGQLKPITKDHSLVAHLIDAGQLKAGDVYDHPQRNLITRSLGAGHKNVEVDVFHLALEPGDMLLLCSDGLWEMIRDEAKITRILSSEASLDSICQQLIQAANDGGGEDNITALVVRCSS
jgi:protein phosphatase